MFKLFTNILIVLFFIKYSNCKYFSTNNIVREVKQPEYKFSKLKLSTGPEKVVFKGQEIKSCSDGGDEVCASKGPYFSCIDDRYTNFKCECYTGYKEVRGNCIEIKSCRDGGDTECANKGEYFYCIDDYSGYTHYNCQCHVGYKEVDGNCIEKHCTNTTCIDESTTCEEKENGFYCKCNPGFRLKENITNENENQDRCLKINICERQYYFCDVVTTVCVPKDLYDFYCKCKDGYILPKDVSEKENKGSCYAKKGCDGLGNHECINKGPHWICVDDENSYYNYRCQCKDGYKMEDDQCIEVLNVCDTDKHNCPSLSTTCERHEDDYYCKCKAGFILPTRESEKYNKGACTKIQDICDTDKHNCPSLSTTCERHGDDYYCRCKEGFKLSAEQDETYNKGACTKRDYCEIDLCPTYSTKCISTDNSYFCDCLEGFKLPEGKMKEDNQQDCIELNICERKADICPKISTLCVSKTQTDFYCKCKEGYKLPNGKKERDNKESCIEMNICERQTHICPTETTVCVPKDIYNFYCKCKEGYMLPADMNEKINRGRCYVCDCGGKEISCRFDRNGNKMCTCKPGYVKKNGTCKEKP